MEGASRSGLTMSRSTKRTQIRTSTTSDASAVEAALQLKLKKNAGSEVTVISLGPDVAQETIRRL